MFAKKLQNDQNEYLIIDDNGSEYFSKGITINLNIFFIASKDFYLNLHHFCFAA